jgi:hypothetical protein
MFVPMRFLSEQDKRSLDYAHGKLNFLQVRGNDPTRETTNGPSKRPQLQVSPVQVVRTLYRLL